MRASFWIFLAVLLAIPATWILLQWLRTRNAQKKGAALYATVTSIKPETVFGKPSQMMKIAMSIQEGTVRRTVTMRSRIAPGQRVVPGALLAVVVDPLDTKRVFPAGPDAMKRMQITGSRQQRRQMKQQGL